MNARTVYFVSVNGVDWQALNTWSARAAQDKASILHPMGIYGSIYLGVWNQARNCVDKLLIRSPKFIEGRETWLNCFRVDDPRIAYNLKHYGVAFALKVGPMDKVRLLSVTSKAAKQCAARSPFFKAGDKVEIYVMYPENSTLELAIVGDCIKPGVIRWRKSVVEFFSTANKDQNS